MVTNSILPSVFIQKLATAATPLTTESFIELGSEFGQWQKSSFNKYEINELVHARAEFVDFILKKIWAQHHLDEHQIALIAVGGYGRGELHPHSDVDILLLTQPNITDELVNHISEFITQLWDIRLDIGHSVRSVSECVERAKKDVTIATNLLESRRICGNKLLEEQLTPHLQKESFWPSQDFFIAKRDEQVKRHQQYKGAAYTLEPNLKANPGGLRDIQNVSWVALRHFDVNVIEELIQHRYLTRNEYYELVECQDYLWRMRFALHVVAKRNENRLLFDYQGSVAEMMGFGDEGKPAIERMMKRFFRVINYVSELNEMLLQHFHQAILNSSKEQGIVSLDSDFSLIGNLINIKNTRGFTRPEMIIKLFLMIAEHKEIKGIHSQTIRLLRNSRRRLISGLNDYAECRRLFMEFVRHPRGFGRAFNLMHKHEILASYLPEWRSIVGQMQFDLFHAYSVDEHSYRLIKNLYRFSRPEHRHEFPLCTKIMQRIRKPELLYLGGVFHDIAKGRGGNHSDLGAIDALEFGKMHGLSKHDSRLISWLVKNHLLMSVTAQRKDISDPDVIKEFGNIVRDEARLDYLYCLTVADMRATNESLWNSWKANLLEELYFATRRAFRRGLEKPVELRTKIRENQAKAIELSAQNGIDKNVILPLWKKFKADYFLRYSPEQIAWHTRHILTHNTNRPLVLISEKPYRGGTEVFVYTQDKSNIFATTVTALGMKKLSIHDAKILTSKDNFTLNTFVVLDSRDQPIKDLYVADEVKSTLSKLLEEDSDLPVIKKPLPTKFKQFNFPIQVSFIQHNTKRVTSLEIVAIDRPGLLAEIGDIFQQHKINVHMAKITTFGERAEDMFIISNEEQLALSQNEQDHLESLLSKVQ